MSINISFINMSNRAYVFTCFDLTLEETLQSLNSTYIVYGREICPSTLREHLQGYMYFKNKKSFKSLQKLLPGVHLEIARGTPSDNFVYCTKDGDIYEKGTRPEDPKDQGKKEKQRWSDARQAAQSGNFDDIPDDIFVRYYRTLKEIKKDYMVKPPDAEDVTGVWIWGPAGIGKSRRARELYPNAYFKLCNKWWDGYQNEENVIIDDVDPNHHVLGHHFKIWSDRYAFTAETKGGALMIRPKRIIITSQYSPEQIWADAPTIDAIRRRFKITHMDALKIAQGGLCSITTDPLGAGRVSASIDADFMEDEITNQHA